MKRLSAQDDNNTATTNGVFTTPTINGASGGTGVATAATVSTIVMRDSSGNINIVNAFEGFRSQATAAGTTTLVIGDGQVQEFTGSTTQTVKLPTTGIPAGAQYYIINSSSGTVTVQSSGANTIVILAAGVAAIFTALVATPTTAANWRGQYMGDAIASGKKLSVSNTLTLAGTDSTTMTFPTTSATIARTDAANTFTGHQTIEGVTSTGATGTGALVFGTSPTLTTPVVSQFNTSSGLGAAWTSYTPTWGGGTVPNIGNGILAGRYMQIGKTVHLQIYVKMGSTTSYGSGAWTWSLPITSASITSFGYSGSCRILDSGTTYYTASSFLATTTTVQAHITSGSEVGATNPMTFAVNDIVSIAITYEAA